MASKKKSTRKSATIYTAKKGKNGRTYHFRAGKFISSDEWKAGKELERLAREEKREAARIQREKGQATRGNTKSGRKLPTKDKRNKRSMAVESGGLPKPDSVIVGVESKKFPGKPVNAYLWTFKGLQGMHDAQNLLDNVTRLYGREPKAQISIGTGYGKDAMWVGSKLKHIDSAKLYIREHWKNRASGKEVRARAPSDDLLWIEVEIVTTQTFRLGEL